MSSGEILLTALVALLVFGPERLPSLARQLGKLVNRINHYKQLLLNLWQEQNNNDQLQENIKKAAMADKEYTHRQ